jgi:prophage maintenance system killer protein
VRYDDIDFLEVEDVDLAHEAALLEGGMPGTRDECLVESAVKAPQNMYATSLAEVAASYVVGIANNHGYVER